MHPEVAAAVTPAVILSVVSLRSESKNPTDQSADYYLLIYATSKMTERIQESLRHIERDENVRILFACESGSRAWGFPSADSDYDVRFIYVRPTEWYLAIDEGRDVIQRPIDGALDISGWELRKALRLLRRSNPPLLEWIGSPIVYLEQTDVTQRLKSLARECYHPLACFHHYLHMANNIFRDHLQGETVSAKKYLYVLRPILALRWIEQGRGLVPTEFETLRAAVMEDAGLGIAVADLMDRKSRASESDREPRVAVLHSFIEPELARLADVSPAPPPKNDPTTALNEFFRKVLASAEVP